MTVSYRFGTSHSRLKVSPGYAEQQIKASFLSSKLNTMKIFMLNKLKELDKELRFIDGRFNEGD